MLGGPESGSIWICYRFCQSAFKAIQFSVSPCCYSRLMYAKCESFFKSVMLLGFMIPSLPRTMSMRGVRSLLNRYTGVFAFSWYFLFFFSLSYRITSPGTRWLRLSLAFEQALKGFFSRCLKRFLFDHPIPDPLILARVYAQMNMHAFALVPICGYYPSE